MQHCSQCWVFAKPKLILDLETRHPNHAIKALNFFGRHETSLKHPTQNLAGSFQFENSTLGQVTCDVALEISMHKKAHAIGETLLKSCLLKTAQLLAQSYYIWRGNLPDSLNGYFSQQTNTRARARSNSCKNNRWTIRFISSLDKIIVDTGSRQRSSLKIAFTFTTDCFKLNVIS